MGTNVFAIINTVDKSPYIDRITAAAKEGNFNEINRILEEYENRMNNERVHIGKRSGGWKFLFNHNNWRYYGWTKDSIMHFLSQCDYIENEYHDRLTPEQFWEEYIENFKDGVDGEDYAKREYEDAVKYDKEPWELKSWEYIPPLHTAEVNFNRARRNNYYQEIYNNLGEKMDYKKMIYRFSNSTDFR